MAKEAHQEDGDGSKRTRIEWHEDEWLKLLAHALPVQQSEGLKLADALTKVQSSVVGRARMRRRQGIYFSLLRKQHEPFLKRLQAMSEAERQALIPPPKRPRHIPQRNVTNMESRIKRMPGGTLEVRTMRANYHGGFHWTDYEWALVVREAMRLHKTGEFRVQRYKRSGQEPNPCSLIIEAQDNALPPSRRRSIEGLKKDFYDKASAQAMRLKVERMAQYVDAILEQPIPPVFARAVQADNWTPGASAATATTPDSQESAPVAAAADAEALHSQGIARAEADAADPNAGRDDVPRVSPHALAFATKMAYAVDELLNGFTSSITQSVDDMLSTRLADISEAMAANVARHVTGDIQANLARVVHLLMQQELGPIAAPSPEVLTPASAPAEVPPRATVLDEPPPRPKRIPVDVVGLRGHQKTIVRAALAPRYPQLDLRILELKESDRAQYRDNVIAVTKFLNHGAEERARSHGANLIRVNGAAQSVIAAVHDLMTKVQAAQPMHH